MTQHERPEPACDAEPPSLGLDVASPYAHRADVKDPALLATMNALTRWHAQRCQPYANIVERLFPEQPAMALASVPYLPVRLFKSQDLRSVEPSQVIKTLTSSGTTGQSVSRIHLDRETSMRQTRVLSAIVASFLGRQRWPMLIVDSADLIQDRRRFNARAAAVLGFSVYGRDHRYCLDESLSLDLRALQEHLDRHPDTPTLLFGFTFIVWQGLYQSAVRQGVRLRFPPGSVLIHGGGWKRLADQQVDNDTFKASMRERFGIEHVHNYYGMVEQVGSIFMECEHGHLHSPSHADVIVRDPHTLEPLGAGQAGVLEVLSALPLSYPGHALLTEDMGTLWGRDDCPCGRLGAHFTVHGRLPQVEVRGCSDTRVMT